jgi:hypothetical protein
MKLLITAFIACLLALSPAAAFADDGKNDEGFLLRVRGDVTIPAGETIGSVVVIDGNATIAGTVKNSVTVIKGDALITGSVAGNLTVISGSIDLRAGSTVKNVHAIRSDLTQANGATVTGSINRRDNFQFPAGIAAALSILFWASMTLAVLVAGLVFAAVGGRQLKEAAGAMIGDAVNTIIGMVFLWVAVPMLAVAAMLTLVGIPLGLGVLVFLLPSLWFLGYIVAGAWLGSFIFKATGTRVSSHPFAATTLGLVLFQLMILVPVIGAMAAFLAGIWGAGALAYIAYQAAGGKGFGTPSPSPAGTPAPAV